MRQTKWKAPVIASEFLTRVESILEETLNIDCSEDIHTVLQYPLAAKGQMIRPFCAFVTAHTVCSGGLSTLQTAKLESFAAAVELLHHASLIHDDVLDGELERRGVQCLHRVYGEKSAILSGNIYYIKAIELVMRTTNTPLALDFLDAAARMCQGELLQQLNENTIMSDEVYLEVIRGKTASLTALSCRGAALIAGADSEKASIYEKIGEILGIMYQLLDDSRDDDANIRCDFDFPTHLDFFGKQLSVLLQLLGGSEYIKYFKEFIEILGG